MSFFSLLFPKAKKFLFFSRFVCVSISLICYKQIFSFIFKKRIQRMKLQKKKNRCWKNEKKRRRLRHSHRTTDIGSNRCITYRLWSEILEIEIQINESQWIYLVQSSLVSEFVEKSRVVFRFTRNRGKNVRFFCVGVVIEIRSGWSRMKLFVVFKGFRRKKFRNDWDTEWFRDNVGGLEGEATGSINQ